MTDAEAALKLEAIVTRRKRHKALRYSLYVSALVLILFSIRTTIIEDTDWERIGSFREVLNAVGRFFPPDWAVVNGLIGPTVETLMIATLGTLLAVMATIPTAWMAARNITPMGRFSYLIGRSVITLTRSVHEVVWGLLFVAAVGLGAFPGIIAIGLRSVGFISKLTAEAIEDIKVGQIEAIKSVGGNRIQVFLYAVVPQILPIFLGNSIFQWDINIRRATIMGLVGAGGLGLTFFRQMTMYNYQGVTTVILAILVLIGIGEVVSYYARKAVL